MSLLGVVQMLPCADERWNLRKLRTIAKNYPKEIGNIEPFGERQAFISPIIRHGQNIEISATADRFVGLVPHMGIMPAGDAHREYCAGT